MKQEGWNENDEFPQDESDYKGNRSRASTKLVIRF